MPPLCCLAETEIKRCAAFTNIVDPVDWVSVQHYICRVGLCPHTFSQVYSVALAKPEIYKESF